MAETHLCYGLFNKKELVENICHQYYIGLYRAMGIVVECFTDIMPWVLSRSNMITTHWKPAHFQVIWNFVGLLTPTFPLEHTVKTSTRAQPRPRFSSNMKWSSRLQNRPNRNNYSFSNSKALKRTDHEYSTVHNNDRSGQSRADVLDSKIDLRVDEIMYNSIQSHNRKDNNHVLSENPDKPVNNGHTLDKRHDCEQLDYIKMHGDVLTKNDTPSIELLHPIVPQLDVFQHNTDCGIENVNDFPVPNSNKSHVLAQESEATDCGVLNSRSNDERCVDMRETDVTEYIDALCQVTFPKTCQMFDVRNSDQNDSSDINIRAVKRHNNKTLEDHLPLDSNDSHVLRNDSVPRALYRNNEVPTNDPRCDCDHADNARKMKRPTTSAGLTCNVVHFTEQIPDQPAILKDLMKKLTNDTERVVGPRDLMVLPVLQNNIEELRRIVEKTVQGESVPAQESMRFELLRSCTYRTFPKDGKPDVRKLAAAGFYYASNSDEVICYCCYKRISNWKADDDPLAIHRRISPECRFFTDAATVNVTKELTAQVESEIMAKIQGGRQRNNTPQSAPLPTRTDSPSPGNVANTGVSLRQRQPARAHGQFAMAHSGETSLPMHQPPVSTRESTKFQSMMPQMSRNETASPNRSQFQTGVFVPQGNFRVPVIDTRAVQPSEDSPGQDAVIDEYVRESHSRIAEVTTSVTTSSALAETSRASTEPLTMSLDSLIRSDASVLVQGMGYELPIVRQALSNLLHRGQTRPNAEEIMNEIFQIEDGTTY